MAAALGEPGQEEEALGKAYDSRLMARLLRYLKPYRWQVLLAVFILMIAAAMAIVGPYLTKIALDDAIPDRDRRLLALLGATYGTVILFSFSLQYAQAILTTWLGQRVMYDLRTEIFRKLQTLDLRFYDRNPVGRLMTRITSDVETLNELFSVHDPELVLLDEPTSGLDPVGRRQMLELVKEVGERGISVLLSTHLLHDVEQVCDAVVLLDKGQLALQGELDALRKHHGWVYEVRVREEEPGSFARALTAKGLAIEEDLDGLLRVTLESTDENGSPWATRTLFEIARAVGAEIRHLRKFEKNLEEQFLTAVRTGEGPS